MVPVSGRIGVSSLALMQGTCCSSGGCPPLAGIITATFIQILSLVYVASRHEETRKNASLVNFVRIL
jgi:hypothetical protein